MKRALLVGINKYRVSSHNLHGCLNDVLDFYKLLTSHTNIRDIDIEVVTDERATKDNIVGEFEKLLRKTEDNDTAIFYYSGHGSQVPDMNGDEEDGLDEIICPTDLDWNDPLSDDVFAELMQKYQKKQAKVWNIFDSCHSGTMTRDISTLYHSGLDNFDPSAYMPGYARNKYIQSPLEVRIKEATRNIKKVRIGNFIKQQNRSTRNQFCLSASKSYQTSAEMNIDGMPHGVFTYCLTDLMKKNPDMKVMDLLKMIIPALSKFCVDQIPDFDYNPLELNTLLFA